MRTLTALLIGIVLSIVPAPQPHQSGWTSPAGITGPFEPYAALDASQVHQLGGATFYIDADVPGCEWTEYVDGSAGWGCEPRILKRP
jgi:hypothetical protein